MNDKYITVSQLTRYIKYKIDNDTNLNEVFLKGEISNFKAHSRGHFYFTLKDEGSRINAIMFSSSTKKIKFLPTDGMKVLVTGKISVFEANGAYQIYVNDMLEDGVGNLYIAYEQLKKKLELEGLFDVQYKKKIPKIPTRIGVVTAPTGAAIKDILSTIRRRWPMAEVFLFPSLVQGEEAAADIVAQIQLSEEYNLDTLIVGRGGGSIEDMWPFNEEIVARAIFQCSTPVISAVGHEVDFTIADFVADLRAPTPTGAAELAVPSIQDVSNYLNQLQIRLQKVIQNEVRSRKNRLTEMRERYVFKNPISIYQTKEMIFDGFLERLKHSTISLLSQKEKAYLEIRNSYLFQNPISIYQPKQILFGRYMERFRYSITKLVTEKERSFLNIKNSYILKSPYQLLDKKANKYLQIISKLEPLSPLLTLKRGYSIVKKDQKVITSIKQVKKKEQLDLELMDGQISVEVL